MDFRQTRCAWCALKNSPAESCLECPKFRKYGLIEEIVLDADAFCGKCSNSGESGLEVFCRTNRKLQQGSDEPFDCYKFSLITKEAAKATTHVVTAFLTHGGKVCLVRRSSRVGTYQGRFSGISGYLEGDPLTHALREIREETSIGRESCTLLRRAETVVVEDEREARVWCVHPFLFEVADPSALSLDWENTESRWIDPLEMKDLETVPGLFRVWERISRMPLEEDTARFVRELKEDMENGARQLASRAIDFLGRMVRSSNAATFNTLMDDLSYACSEIGRARPSMAVLSTSLGLVLSQAMSLGVSGMDDARDRVLALVKSHLKEMDEANDLATGHLDEVIPQGAVVMMHSYSSSLVHALPLLKSKGCSLVLTESRPGLEGRAMASLANDLGIRVKLVVDACAGHELAHADMVLLGADSIEQDGSVVNKAGSSLIAAAAHAMGVKVFFLGEKRKICMDDSRTALEEYHPGEVWDRPPKGVEVGNLYFDRTPPTFITGIVLEQGVVEPGSIKDVARSMFPGGTA